MPLRTPFWQRAARALPPAVRERYAADLVRAEQIDLVIGAVIDAWRQARSAIAVVGEMGFSSALHAELEGIALAKREAERSPWSLGRLERKLRRLKLHRICAPEAMRALSRLDTRSSFLQALHDAGRAQADAWLMGYLARDTRARGVPLPLETIA